MTYFGILENLVSDVIFIVIAIFIGWVFLLLTRQRRLHRFFLTNKSKRLTVYLSNLNILPFGAAGIDGRKMSYQGSAVAFGEMQSANRLRELFALVVPSVSDDPGFLRRLLLSDVKVQITISPFDSGDLETGSSVVTLGSGAYNTMSSYIEEDLEPFARFRYGILTVDDSQVYTVDKRPTAYSTDSEVQFIPGLITPSGLGIDARRPDEEEIGSAIEVDGIPPIEDPTYGFIERIYEEDADRFIFFIAGLSEYSTVGAANYLLTQWLHLDKKFMNKQHFLVLLNFDDEDNRKWTVVLERAT